MSILGESRSIQKAEAESLAGILALYYNPMFGKVFGMYINTSSRIFVSLFWVHLIDPPPPTGTGTYRANM
jgi:hypothetical protein